MQAGSELSRGSGRDNFPWSDFTFHDKEDRMWFRLFDSLKLLQPVMSASLEFPAEMRPLIFDLSACDCYRRHKNAFADFLLVKMVPPSNSFGVNLLQVGCDIRFRG